MKNDVRALRILAASEGLKQRELAKCIGHSTSKISRAYSSGKVSDEVKKSACQYFHISETQFGILASSAEELDAYDTTAIIELLKTLFVREPFIQRTQKARRSQVQRNLPFSKDLV